MTEIKDVSDTAFMIAVYRALETERPNPLFRDPLARKLAGERGKKIVESLPAKAWYFGWTVIIRTHIIDNYIKSAIENEDIKTILNLGAGLDTRPYRMDLPNSIRWIEADFPSMIDFKEKELANEKPRCQLERVKVDLTDALARKKFFKEVASHSKKTLILTEGLVPYLPPEEVAALASELRSEPSFRYWVVDYFSHEAYEYRRREEMKTMMRNAPFLFEPKDYFGFFAEHGWSTKEIRFIGEESERIGRHPPLPITMLIGMKIVTLFLSRKRREAIKRYAAYVMFEPS